MQQIKITLSVAILLVKQTEYHAQTCIKRHSVENFSHRQELTVWKLMFLPVLQNTENV